MLRYGEPKPKRGSEDVTTTILLNLFLVTAAVAALAAVCRIPYRVGDSEREHAAKPEPLYEVEDERQAV